METKTVDIAALTKQQKSVMLARLAELQIEYEPVVLIALAQFHSTTDIIDDLVPDLYDPANMELAWRCLLWVSQGHEDWRAEFQNWFADTAFELMGEEHAQRIWLDKLLELAISAGLIAPVGVKDE